MCLSRFYQQAVSLSGMSGQTRAKRLRFDGRLPGKGASNGERERATVLAYASAVKQHTARIAQLGAIRTL